MENATENLRESRNFSLLHKEQMIFTLHFLKTNERNSLWHHGLGTTLSTTFLANLLHVHKCVSHHESYSKINLEHKDKDKDNDKHKAGFYPGFVKCISQDRLTIPNCQLTGAVLDVQKSSKNDTTHICHKIKSIMGCSGE